MTFTIDFTTAEALKDITKTIANARSVPQTVGTPKQEVDYSQETHSGEPLTNFTSRTPTEDGQFVHVVQHKEWVEKLPQPPTAEEIAEQKEIARLRDEREKRQTKMVLAGLGALAVGFGALVYFDSRSARRVVETTEKVLSA